MTAIISQYLGAVQSAMMAFPMIALALTIPYMFYEYRRYGAIPFLRTVLVYAFILYLINAYFQVILPLPSRAEVAASAGKGMQLEVGRTLREIRQAVSFPPHSWAEVKAMLRKPVVYQAVLNLVLLLPLGVYLHYYFRRGFFLSVLLCGLCSLFFELTQYTGLYGIYAHAYRTFDVDDLILNTIGGTLGWLLAPLFVFFLPSREKIDGAAYERGKGIPLLRRFLAFIIDFSLITLMQLGISLAVPRTPTGYICELASSVACTALYFSAFPKAAGGYTIGKWLLRLRLVSVRSGRKGSPSFLQYLLRALYVSLFLAHLPHYYILCQYMKQQTVGPVFNIWKNLQNLTRFAAALFIIEVLARMIMGDKVFFYERLSGIRNESTIAAGEGKGKRKGKKTSGTRSGKKKKH